MPNLLLRRTLSRLASGLDIAFAGAALTPTRRFVRGARTAPVVHDTRMRALALIGSFYARPEFLTLENEFFPRPAPIAPDFVRVRDLGRRGEVIDLSWPSTFEPLWSREAVLAHVAAVPERAQSAFGPVTDAAELAALGIDRSADLREKYMRARANRTARARWFRHAGAPRPCVVLVHGYMAGTYAIEERLWQVKRLFKSGLDVVLTVLPLHGPRRSETRGYRPPAFPSSDPRFTIEGFRQVVFDHRALLDYLRSAGVTDLGIMGMSLGGYSAALLATLERELRFAVFFVPLAAIEDFAHQSGAMTGSEEEQLAVRDALRAAQLMVSPFARASLVPADRVIVVAGESDRVTGVQQARRLAEHFGAEMSLFHGGHLLHAGREQAFAPVWRLLGAFAASGLG